MPSTTSIIRQRQQRREQARKGTRRAWRIAVGAGTATAAAVVLFLIAVVGALAIAYAYFTRDLPSAEALQAAFSSENGEFFQTTRIGRALRAVADSHRAALSVGISLEQIWVVVWFAAGIVALATGIMWGARSNVSFALEIIALKALPVLILGGFTSIPGAIIGGVIIGVGEKLGEFYWGPLLGSGIESWLAYVIALVFLLFRPQGLFGERIIERV